MRRLKIFQRGVPFFVLTAWFILLFAGSPHAQMQVISSNGAVLMHITEDGRVGVGTTNPSSRLHVMGGVRMQELQENNAPVHYFPVIPAYEHHP